MSTHLSADILSLLDGPSDLECSGVVAHADPLPSTCTSLSAAGGNPPVVKAKAKSKKSTRSSDEVTRQEFASLQDKISTMADAMQTLQSTVLASLGNPPTKKQKVDHAVADQAASSSSDESFATGQLIDNLLKSDADDNSSAGVLTAVEQFYSGEDSGNKVDEKLAGVISKLLRKKTSEEKVAEKLNSFKRPSNIPEMDVTRVNPEIWNSLQSKTRSMDIKLQKVEHAALKGMVPIVSCIETLMSNKSVDHKTLVTNLLDSMAIIGHTVTQLNFRRRELIKPDLNQQYSSLCSAQVPVTGLLFGDDLPKQCKDIQETNKLGQKFGQRSSSSAAPKSDRARQRGNAKTFHTYSGQTRQGNSSRPKRWQKRKPAQTRQQSDAK
ncbi:uncharacterized protein LOC119741467 [Patiria miniata]|uniref:Uncharacterized protein n=1 Tax=Patiria miniata TaxID=46514 RepID=A0A914BAD0_PATMI|nr:uncharacterized protein LOC119741467 [Patiria miniata]